MKIKEGLNTVGQRISSLFEPNNGRLTEQHRDQAEQAIELAAMRSIRDIHLHVEHDSNFHSVGASEDYFEALPQGLRGIMTAFSMQSVSDPMGDRDRLIGETEEELIRKLPIGRRDSIVAVSLRQTRIMWERRLMKDDLNSDTRAIGEAELSRIEQRLAELELQRTQ